MQTRKPPWVATARGGRWREAAEKAVAGLAADADLAAVRAAYPFPRGFRAARQAWYWALFERFGRRVAAGCSPTAWDAVEMRPEGLRLTRAGPACGQCGGSAVEGIVTNLCAACASLWDEWPQAKEAWARLREDTLLLIVADYLEERADCPESAALVRTNCYSPPKE